jgi:hypothetical protein
VSCCTAVAVASTQPFGIDAVAAASAARSATGSMPDAWSHPSAAALRESADAALVQAQAALKAWQAGLCPGGSPAGSAAGSTLQEDRQKWAPPKTWAPGLAGGAVGGRPEGISASRRRPSHRRQNHRVQAGTPDVGLGPQKALRLMALLHSTSMELVFLNAIPSTWPTALQFDQWDSTSARSRWPRGRVAATLAPQRRPVRRNHRCTWMAPLH